MKKHKLKVGGFDSGCKISGNNGWFSASDKLQRLTIRASKFIITGLGVALLMSSSDVSASLTVTFEDTAVNTPLSNVPGWAVSTANNAPSAPFSWITEYDSGGTISKAAAIGGFFDAPASSTYRATVGAQTMVSGALIAFDLGIFDSSNLYPDRDTFGFSVNSQGGNPFISVLFTPVVQSLTPEEAIPTGLWQLSYTFRGGSTVNTAYSLSEGSIYNMSLSFMAGSVLFGVDNGLSTVSFSGLPSGYVPGTEVISGIAFDWSKSSGNSNYGDNFVIVDNIQGIPEPGRIMLLGFGAVGVLFRRQRRI